MTQSLRIFLTPCFCFIIFSLPPSPHASLLPRLIYVLQFCRDESGYIINREGERNWKWGWLFNNCNSHCPAKPTEITRKSQRHKIDNEAAGVWHGDSFYTHTLKECLTAHAVDVVGFGESEEQALQARYVNTGIGFGWLLHGRREFFPRSTQINRGWCKFYWRAFWLSFMRRFCSDRMVASAQVSGDGVSFVPALRKSSK